MTVSFYYYLQLLPNNNFYIFACNGKIYKTANKKRMEKFAIFNWVALNVLDLHIQKKNTYSDKSAKKKIK